MTVQTSSPTPRPIPEQTAPNVSAGFDVERVRQQFPILNEKVHGKPLVYLDNAATSQKAQAVIDAMSRFFGKVREVF